MKKLRDLRVEFDERLQGYEIPAFRGALIEKVGREHILFHHHINNNSFLNKYPLIQYKHIRNQPALICLEEGADEIHNFFNQKDWNINIKGRDLNLKIDNLKVQQYNMQVWNKTFNYAIYKWMALNQDNYRKYNEMDGLSDRIQFLEKTMRGHILSFAKGIEWHIDKKFEIKITDIINTKWVNLKDQRVLAFDLNFQTNIFIPDYVGIGKSASIGFGVIKHYFENKNKQNKND